MATHGIAEAFKDQTTTSPQTTSTSQGDANTVSPMATATDHHNGGDLLVTNNDEELADNRKLMMTTSTPPHLLSTVLSGDNNDNEDEPPVRPPRRNYTHRNPTAIQKEREERVRKIREQQDEERRQKLEELKQHAISAQKFREQQESERKRRLEEMRYRDNDKRSQVEERRRAIESAERERKEALLKKNQEREDRIMTKRRAQLSQINFAFGSSTPRMGYATTNKSDSSSDVYANTTRSTSSSNVHAHLMTQSMYSTTSPASAAVPNNNRRSSEREQDPSSFAKAKRATSAHGLDKRDDGEDALMSQSYHPSQSSTAHRRRTDLMPTVTVTTANNGSIPRSTTPLKTLRSGRTVSMSRLDQLSQPRNRLNLHATPKNTSRKSPPSVNRRPKKSISMSHLAQSSQGRQHSPPKRPARLNKTNSPAKAKSPGVPGSRSPSAQSGNESANSNSAVVRLRNTASTPRRPRPISIATTGIMSTSLYERRPHSNASSTAATPTRAENKFKPPGSEPRGKRTRSATSDKDEEAKSNSSVSSTPVAKPRTTPAQVKARSAERKAKAMKNTTVTTTSSSSSSPVPPVTSTVTAKKEDIVVEPASIEAPVQPQREVTPDIIKTPVKEVTPEEPEVEVKEEDSKSDPEMMAEATPVKKIITSEEEAKARLAEKRREMKEKMEKEAELERQRLAEEARLEAERLAREEEEERKAMKEAERLAVEARRMEEERLQKAIEEAQKREEEEKKKRLEEEKMKREKEEADKKAQEEAERKQAELEEKLRKDEEERLARKKRIEEIMARTRGGNKTPKKEVEAVVNNNGSAAEETQQQQPPTQQPDLLGDIVHANQPQSSSPEIEKGVMDMHITEQAKEDLMNAKNSEAGTSSSAAPLLDLSELSLKQPTATDGQQIPVTTEFDQILDLGENTVSSSNNNNNAEATPPATPIIAFEESINASPKQEVPTADLLS